MKLGEAVYLRLAHLGEEPRAYVTLKPRPAFINVPVLECPPAALLADPIVPVIEYARFGVRRYPFREAVALGIVREEDYYKGHPRGHSYDDEDGWANGRARLDAWGDPTDAL